MSKEGFIKEVLLELRLEGQAKFFKVKVRVNSICIKYMHKVELLFRNHNSSIYERYNSITRHAHVYIYIQPGMM